MLNYDPSKFTGPKEDVATEELPKRGGGEGRTEWVAPKNTFKAQDHDWVQRGYEISCKTCPLAHGTFIPVGKTLTGERGNWTLIDDPRG